MDKTNKLELFLAEKQKKQDEKKIVMLLDKVYEFDNITDVADKTNMAYNIIARNVSKRTEYAIHSSGLKAKFMRKSEYNKLSKDEIDSILAEIDGEKLVLLNTGQEFNSVKELANYLNIVPQAINKHLKGGSKSCGKLINKKCVIRYKRDYIKLSENEIKKLIRYANSKVRRKTTKHTKDVVVLFNTEEIFKSKKEIYSKYGVTNSNLYHALKESKTHIGGYMGNIPLVWFYGEDYNNLTEEDIKYYNQVIKENTKQNIVLYNNGKIYSKDFIVNTLNISINGLHGCLRGESKSSGKYKGFPLVWLYEDKYNSLTEKDREELNKYIKDNSTRYYFVNEGKPFYNIVEFSRLYNISDPSIHNCLNKKQKSVKWKDGERAIFIFLDEFNSMSKEQREEYLAECEIERYKKYPDYKPKPIKSYTEGIEFDSYYEASKYYGVDCRKVSKAVKNNKWITDEHNKPLKFEDIEKEKGEE